MLCVNQFAVSRLGTGTNCVQDQLMDLRQGYQYPINADEAVEVHNSGDVEVGRIRSSTSE